MDRFDIPIPSFIELFKEHAVAPFFVFQMFCVALWFLDEMWYYSLFTLFMLIVFESTVIMQVIKHFVIIYEFRLFVCIQIFKIVEIEKSSRIPQYVNEAVPNICLSYGSME